MFAYYDRHRRRRAHWGPAFAFATCGSDFDLKGPRVSFSASRPPPGDNLFGGGGLGVRRPLRFLTWRLDLSREQVAQAARVIERLKIEREQANVDLRRAAAEMADAVEAASFDRTRMDAAHQRRIDAARSVQDAVGGALEEFHGFLDEEQRETFAALIRSREITF
ncbi:MAG: Spy/CpxP family protein refolding chaperone [Myxococcota bacterium]